MVEMERTYNMQKYKILKQIMQNMSYKKDFFIDLSKCDYIFLHCKYKGKHKLFFIKQVLGYTRTKKSLKLRIPSSLWLKERLPVCMLHNTCHDKNK